VAAAFVVSVPSVEELDALPVADFAAAIAPLFEGAPRFLARLAAARPLGSDETLIVRAREIARSMPEAEQIELIDAHPRLGAPPGSVSAMSFVEQGYDRPKAEQTAEEERGRVATELERLNAAYEECFGFRYCVYVAGRPRSALLAGMARALTADRDAEIRRAVDDVVAIAEDRLRRLRAEASADARQSTPEGRP
jgi:2-oxo-4-hydroxy-4-carboxy-5-ureidoimidazoline decarboxylase